MDPRATPPLRILRGALLAAVVVSVGSLAHVLAGGALPGWPTMVALYGTAGAACSILLGREASALRLVTVTVGGQVIVHGVLSEVAGHAGAGMPGMSHGAHGGMQHAEASGALVPTWLSHGVLEMLADPVMATLHLMAAAAVGLWLAVGERALWSLIRLARCTAKDVLAHASAALGLLPVVLRAIPRAVGVRAVHVDPLPLLPVWSRGPARRGPPVGLLPR